MEPTNGRYGHRRNLCKSQPIACFYLLQGIEYNIPNANIHVERRKGSLRHHRINWIPGAAKPSTVEIGHRVAYTN